MVVRVGGCGVAVASSRRPLNAEARGGEDGAELRHALPRSHYATMLVAAVIPWEIRLFCHRRNPTVASIIAHEQQKEQESEEAEFYIAR